MASKARPACAVLQGHKEFKGCRVKWDHRDSLGPWVLAVPLVLMERKVHRESKARADLMVRPVRRDCREFRA